MSGGGSTAGGRGRAAEVWPAAMELGAAVPLRATRLRAADLADLVALHADPAVMATLGGGLDADATRVFLDAAVAHWEHHGFGLYALRDRATGAFAGRAGARRVEILGRRRVEIAYALRARCWGRGLAAAVAARLTEAAAASGLDRDLVAFTSTTNGRSRRVLEKIGFGLDRTFDHAGLPHVLYRWPPAAGDGRDCFVRWESARPDEAGRHLGVFGLVNVLGRRGMLTAEEEAFRRAANAWYDAAYPDPCAADPGVYDEGRHPGAAAWFRADQAGLLARVPAYLAVLDAHAVAWRKRCSDAPGRVVYDDAHQVVVVGPPG